MDQLSGIVERITYVNEDNGFCVLKIKAKGYPDLVTVVGSLAAVTAGTVLRLSGEWKMDSRFGRQFSVRDYQETLPATVAGIEKYLGSGLIKGIGPAYAKRIVSRFREDTLRILEEEAEYLIQVEGIGRKRVEMIKKAWQDQKEIKNVMIFLQGHGVTTAYAVKIFKTYGNDSIAVVKENPYRLADDIWGIGFRTADKIARQMGFDPHSYARCRSGLVYTLNELANEGHCFAPREQLLEQGVKLLEIPAHLLESSLKQMLQEQTVIADQDDAVYLPSLFHSELGTARRVRQLIAQPSPYQQADTAAVAARVAMTQGITYDQVQLEAIDQAVCSKCLVLTGGPGTGKTTTTLAIIRVFQDLGARILLAAPTGRAAKRLSEATGMEARTIHRLLEFKPPEGFKKGTDDPLDCDVLIVDETSMVDIVLMYSLLRAVPDEAVLVLVGDVDQLPSVGPGNVLRDIIDSGTVSVVRLTRIFRQASGSAIITNAHRINRGEFPNLAGGRDSDFFFLEEDDPVRVAEAIRDLCTKRLPDYYRLDPVNDIQVLCPMQRGETGAVHLNERLQEALNPAGAPVRYGGTVFRQGDKVMQVKNNYDKNVFNGDIGRILAVDKEERTLLLSFDGIHVPYDLSEMDEVVLAYATTVHKSQGSEYPIVVAPLTLQHYMMLQRNLLYTCVTRARKVMVLVGSKKAVAMAVRNNKITRRHTLLAERLCARDALSI